MAAQENLATGKAALAGNRKRGVLKLLVAPVFFQHCAPVIENGRAKNQWQYGMILEDCHAIHQFWFGTESDDSVLAQRQSSLWWAKKAANDAEIRRRFVAALEKAACGELDCWSGDARSLLALILLTDQFPRTVYRGMSQAYAYDHLALQWCKAGLEAGMHKTLRPIERVFLYMPLEHAESIEEQEQAVQLFSCLMQDIPAHWQTTFQGFLNFSLRHHAVIARFGRFPHRNAILARPSTPEEIAFLQTPGSRF